jgi:hypothetical protein
VTVRPFATLVLVLAALLAGGRSALADDRPALERLTPAELDHVRTHVPDWDDLPEERRERIAKNVLRLRSLPPEERARLRERMERFRRQDVSLRERLPDRLARLRGASRERFRVQALVAAAVGRDVVRGLPDDVRRTIDESRRPPGAQGPAFGPTVLGHAFLRALVEREAEAIGRTGEALRHVPSADVRPRFDALVARANAASPEDRPRELRALSMLVVEDRMREAVRVALERGAGAGTTGDAAARDTAVVAAVRASFADAWQGATDDLLERARRGPDDLRRFLARHAARGDRRANARPAAFLLVRFLEAAGPWLAANPEAREHADRLLESFLGKALGLPAGTLDRLPGWDRPSERVRALKQLLQQR